MDYHIEPLDEFELGDYINHRLGIAGGNNPKAIGFTDEAVKEICQFSQRVPRLINLILRPGVTLRIYQREKHYR